MLASNFVAKLFISVGATGAFYTLRETYLHGKEVWSMHHFNLSQDADEAYEKALLYAHNNAMELTTDRETMVREMREIQRATAAERAERQAKIERADAERAAQIQREHDEKVEMIANGLFPFGRYYNQSFRSPVVPVSYINWLATASFEPDTIIALLQDAVIKACGDLLLPTPDLDSTVGTVGKRTTFNVTVIRYAWFATQYGINHVVTMVDDSGACLVSKGAFSADVGDKLTIKATVKDHSRYNGQMQTVVQRVAIV